MAAHPFFTSVFILADDLIGAVEAANAFRSRGRRVRMPWETDAPWDFTLSPDVVQVCDTQSRFLKPEDARRRIEQVLMRLALKPDLLPRVFKNVDLALRGNVGAEIDAALSALGWPFAVLAPSLPATGRAVRGGRLLVDGVSATQKRRLQGPSTPVRSDRIADAVRQTSMGPVVEIGLGDVRSGVSHLAGVLRRRVHSGTAVVDAETEADLDVIAGAITELHVTLPCGSAGLASSLAGVWSIGVSTTEGAAPSRPEATDAEPSPRAVVANRSPLAKR